MAHYNGSTDKETITLLKEINAELMEELTEAAGWVDKYHEEMLFYTTSDKAADSAFRILASIAKAKNGAA